MIIDFLPSGSGGGADIELDDVSGAVATSYKTTVTLKWSDPSDITVKGVTVSEWSGTYVVRKAGSAPSDRNDGTVVCNNKTRNQYASSGFEDTGLSYGTTYYYRFFPYSTLGVVTDGSSVSASPVKVVISTVPSQSGSLTYSGSSQSPTFSNYDSDELTIAGDTSGTNAGTYTATFTPKADYVWSDNTTTAKSVNWTIGKKSITVPTVSGSYTYDTTQKSASISSFDTDEVTQSGTATAKNAGTYTVLFDLVDTSNTIWGDSSTSQKSGSWSIGKATLTVPTVTDTSKTYNGSAQHPTVTGYDSNTMTRTGYEYTNAGSYTLTFGLADSSNYQWGSGSTSVSWGIAKATYTATVSISGYAYAGTKSTPTVSLNPESGTVTFYGRSTSGGASTAWSNVTSTTYNAGTRYVYAVIAATANYESCTTAETSFTISKGTYSSSVSISGYTYAGTKSTPSVTNNPENGSVTYYGRSTSTGSATAWSSVTSTTYNAGTRYCYAVIAATTNYESVTTANTSFTIAKATLSATVSISGYTYAGTKSTPSISGNSGGGTVTYYGRATSSGTATAWSSVTSTTYNAGTRYIYATIAETTNYNAYTTANTSFTISKATVAITLSTSSVTLDGSHLTASVTVSNVNGRSLSASSDTQTVATASVSGSTVTISNVNQTSGNATVTITAAASTNYNASSKTVSVTANFLAIVTFADGTDAQIKAMLDAYYDGDITWAEMGWAVGNTRKIHLNAMQAPNPNSSNTWAAQDITVVIVAHDHNDLATPINGHSKSCITVQVMEVLNNNLSNKNQPGHIYVNGDSSLDMSFTKWANLYMRTYLNNTVWSAFPSGDFKDAIKPSKHYRHTTYNGSGSELVTDTLFLPSYPEIFGTASSSDYVATSPVEGTQFEYYQTASNRIKYGNNNGASNDVAQLWWEGSPSSSYGSSNGYQWCRVGTSGLSNYFPGTFALGLAPAFTM